MSYHRRLGIGFTGPTAGAISVQRPLTALVVEHAMGVDTDRILQPVLEVEQDGVAHRRPQDGAQVAKIGFLWPTDLQSEAGCCDACSAASSADKAPCHTISIAFLF